VSTPNQPPWGQQPGQGPGGQPPQPGQPPYGQPQGQPPYGRPPGQPPYGQPQGQPAPGRPQPGFTPPNYGGQQPPGSYPTPPPPGTYAPGGPGGYPPRPGQPGQPGPGGVPGGQPPRKGSGARIGLIVGAIVLALIIIGVGAAVLLNRSNQTASDPIDPPITGGTSGGGGGPTGASAPPTGASTVPPPVSTQADQAVKGYLDALAAGQAGVALSLAQEQPADTTFLTDAVLADSLERAPITDIKVTPPANEYDTSISATYKIGDQQVNENFTVQKQGETYLLYRVTQDLSLENLRNRTLPLLINGIEVKTDNIDLFPGSYVFSSGNENISYGSGDPLLIKSPNDYPNAYDYRPAITAAGTKAFVAAAKAKLNACAKEAKFRPSGCPLLAIRESPGQNITESSLRRKITEDPFINVEPRLDYQDPAVAEFSVTVRWEVRASGTINGQRAKFEDTFSNYTSVRGRLTGKDIKVVFGR
jgi:hypothetical protein